MKSALIRAVCAAIVIIVCVACVAALRPDLFDGKNVQEDEGEAVFSQIESTDPIGAFRLERQQLRSMQLAELDDMLNSPSTSAEMLKMAEDEKLAVLKRTEIEETVGSILRAIGFEGAAACFESGCVTVMIYADEPTVEEVARITELILDSVDVSAGDIKIIPIN